MMDVLTLCSDREYDKGLIGDVETGMRVGVRASTEAMLRSMNAYILLLAMVRPYWTVLSHRKRSRQHHRRNHWLGHAPSFFHLPPHPSHPLIARSRLRPQARPSERCGLLHRVRVGWCRRRLRVLVQVLPFGMRLELGNGSCVYVCMCV